MKETHTMQDPHGAGRCRDARPPELTSLVLAGTLLFAGAAAILSPGSAVAVCVPFPCDECWVTNSGQLNLVVLDREANQVRLVPNIRFQGDSPVIALVVPTPAEPSLAPAGSRIWTEASALTSSASRNLTNDGIGCGSGYDTVPVLSPQEDGGVEVLSEQTVGGFRATTVRSDDPDALVDWLVAGGFSVSPSDAERFAPLIADGWVFTAMKSDSTLIMPQDGWNASVDPVEFSWSGDGFEVPLGVLGINRSSSLPMTFYVVDAHRTRLLDFRASYANRVSRSELDAIRERYPTFGAYLREGQFLTRLDRSFFAGTPMEGRVPIEWASNDDEFRNGWGAGGVTPAWRPASLVSSWAALVAWMAGALALFGRAVRRRAGVSDVTCSGGR